MRENRCTNADLHELISAYVFGALNEDQSLAFENHVVQCEACYEDVQTLHVPVLAMKKDRAYFLSAFSGSSGEGTAREASFKKRRTTLSWWQSSPRSEFALASMVILLLIYPAWRGIFVVPNLREKITHFQQPSLNAPFYALEPPGRSERQITDIRIPKEVEFFNLTFGSENALYDQFSVALIDSENKSIWAADGLTEILEHPGTFSIAFHRTFLKDGGYTLKVFGKTKSKMEPVSSYSFRIHQ